MISTNATTAMVARTTATAVGLAAALLFFPAFLVFNIIVGIDVLKPQAPNPRNLPCLLSPMRVPKTGSTFGAARIWKPSPPLTNCHKACGE